MEFLQNRCTLPKTKDSKKRQFAPSLQSKLYLLPQHNSKVLPLFKPVVLVVPPPRSCFSTLIWHTSGNLDIFLHPMSWHTGAILWTTPPHRASTADSKSSRAIITMMTFAEVAYWLAYSLITLHQL